MENILIEGTATTPTVKFQPELGMFSISGRSIPENSAEYYKPLLDCLDRYVAGHPVSPTQVDIQLEYYNTATSRCLLDIFKKMDILKKNGTDVTVNWMFEEDDDDMRDAGEYYQSLVNIRFNITPL